MRVALARIVALIVIFGLKIVKRLQLDDAWHDSKLGGTLKGVINKTGNYPIEDRMIDMKYILNLDKM